MIDRTCPRIDRVKGSPTIGTSYWVPCLTPTPELLDVLKLFDDHRMDWYKEIRPVLLPGHSDPELGAGFHYHIDLRFLSDERLENWYQIVQVEQRDIEDLLIHVDLTACDPIEEAELFDFEWLKLTCHRIMPEFPLFRFASIELRLPSVMKLSARCDRCPHQGLKLGGLLVQPDGTVICPGHGLKINLQTNQLIKRDTSRILACVRLNFWIRFNVEIPVILFLLRMNLSHFEE